MLKPTPEVAQAFASLRGNPDFSTFLRWLRDCEAKERDTCVKGDGAVLYRAQGSAQAFAHILDTNDKASDFLKQVRTQQTPRP